MKITVKRNRKPTKQSEKASKIAESKPAVESYTADAIKTAIDESIADEK
jgi:hypothetical protein